MAPIPCEDRQTWHPRNQQTISWAICEQPTCHARAMLCCPPNDRRSSTHGITRNQEVCGLLQFVFGSCSCSGRSFRDMADELRIGSGRIPRIPRFFSSSAKCRTRETGSANVRCRSLLSVDLNWRVMYIGSFACPLPIPRSALSSPSPGNDTTSKFCVDHNHVS